METTTGKNHQNEDAEKYVPNTGPFQSPRKKKLKEIETSNLSDKESKTLFIRVLSEPRRSIDELGENFNQLSINEIENIKRSQSEIKSTITEMKNTLNGIKGRIDEAENQSSYLKDKIAENTQSEQ